MLGLLPIFLIFITIHTSNSLSFSIKQFDNSEFHNKRNLLMLLKRKFLPIPDPYMTDEIEAKFMRTANFECVLKKLNLKNDEKISREDLKKFDVKKSFGPLAQDMNFIVAMFMQFCIDDIDDYSRYTFEKGIENPILEVTENSTFCCVIELYKMGKLEPLFKESMVVTQNEGDIKCDRIMKKFNRFIADFDTVHYRGCLNAQKIKIAEYLLKFRIMHNMKTDEAIKTLVRNDYMKNNNDKQGDQKIIDCIVEKYYL